MTKGEARDWVHRQLIVDGIDCVELVAAFTALAERPPEPVDRQGGLFVRCCAIVLSSSPTAPPSRA